MDDCGGLLLMNDVTGGQPHSFDYEQAHTHLEEVIGQPLWQEDIGDGAIFRSDVLGHDAERACPSIGNQYHSLDQMRPIGEDQEPIEGAGYRGVNVVNEAAKHPPENDTVDGFNDEYLQGARR